MTCEGIIQKDNEYPLPLIKNKPADKTGQE